MIQILNKKDCCGCNACGDICPKDDYQKINDQEFQHHLDDTATQFLVKALRERWRRWALRSISLWLNPIRWSVCS